MTRLSQVSARVLADWRIGGLEGCCLAIAGVKRNEITLKHNAVVDRPFTIIAPANSNVHAAVVA
jgi:hypothetical protein